MLEAAFSRPIDLSRRFYGQSDALVTSWSLSCKRVKTKRKNIRNPILSLVAAPTGLVDEEGIPLASNFAHALVAVDANRRRLAKRLRRRGFPARKSGLGYRHSEPGVVPFEAALRVPDKYRLNVSASTLDVVHDHQDTFETERGRGGGRCCSYGRSMRSTVSASCRRRPTAPRLSTRPGRAR